MTKNSLSKKERQRLKRIKAVMKGKRAIETLSIKELILLDELLFDAIERINAHRLMPWNNTKH